MIQEHIIKLESKSLSILMARLEKEKVLEKNILRRGRGLRFDEGLI